MTWTSQRLLEAIASAVPDDCVTEIRMAALTGLAERQVEGAARKLRQLGWLEKVGQGCHRLTPAGRVALEAGQRLTSGPRGPQATGQRRRAPGMRQRVWNVLRQGKKVSIDDIAMLVVDGSERDPTSNIGKYLRALARAGYLRRLPIRETPMAMTSNGAIRWQLVSDTGPDAPIWNKARAVVFDPNLWQDIPMARELAAVRKRGAA